MIHLLYGKDRYSVLAALAEIRASLAADDDASGGLESNTTVLAGAATSPQELMAHATAVPFLASSRLVIVEGLLGALGSAKGGRRGKKKADADDPLAPWRQLAAQLGDRSSMPETTTLVFVEGELGRTNPAFTIFAPIATTREFAPLPPQKLPRWIAADAKAAKIKLSDRAAALLASLIGPDLAMLHNEIGKLAAYAGGDPVDEEMVRHLVASAQEAKFWDMTDAIVEGNEKKAVTKLDQLLGEGEPAPLLLSMLVRSYRQIAIVKDMRERRVSSADIERAAGLKGRGLDFKANQASRYGWNDLRSAYRMLLEADLNVKRGLQDDESSLQLAVHELCAMAPRGARPAYAR